MMKNIIFGRNFGNTLGQIRNFGEVGMPVIVVWYGDNHNTPKDSKYISEFYEVSGINEGIDFIIRNFAKDGEKQLLSTDNDGIVGVFNDRYDELEPFFYFYNAGEKGRLSKYMEKEVLCELAEKNGFRIPRTEYVKVGDLPQKLAYPIFTKSSDSFDIDWKKSVSICNNESELLEYYKHQSHEYVLLQEYVFKKDEYILQGISLNRGKDVYIPIHGGYFRLPADAYGSYLHFEKNDENSDFTEKLKKMFSEIEYEGVFEVEFLVDTNDNYFFLEINFRHTLWTHAFTDMGVNLSKIWADSVVENRIIGKPDIIQSPHTLLYEVNDFKRYVPSRKISLFKWLKEVKNADSLLLWDKNDIKPFYMYLLRLLLHKMRLV